MSQESECEDDIEPKLKYVRISNDLRKILSSDAASCVAVHPKFLCLGTHFGKIYLFDHQGNIVTLNSNSKDLPIMPLPINQINIDEKGEFIAACSGEHVIVIGLYSSDVNVNLRLSTCILCVSLDPIYHKPNAGHRFITGGKNLALHEKTFLGRTRTTILCESSSLVLSAVWNNQFIAWSSEEGVRVYDINERCSLGLINWESRSDDIQKYRCNLKWSDSKTLLIGWVDTVRVCVIRKRHTIEISNGNMPEYIVDAVSTFQMDFFISGLGPLELPDQLVVLGYPKEKDPSTGKALRPVLSVLHYKDSDYVEVCTDTLTLPIKSILAMITILIV
ncbi:vacuolar protein sorting-associated protein 41 homolog [Ctenocephalides felis]|uniref:vacuolar protein sorting-associated protein 41 homolog n=1 Tax=Ctenocephalides felis TaxID=7515 RepID=UPI000E6E4790|nr:vacuolar protein sorting-associated protein 41 homolog [Ctenocephalides felis]